VKNLIVNADDLGWTDGVNRGILEAFPVGIDLKDAALQLVVRGEPNALRSGPAAEGLADEPARAVATGPAVVGRAGEEERLRKRPMGP